MILHGKDGILYSLATLRKNSFRWKDLRKALHLIFCEDESKYMLSRLPTQRICVTEVFKSTKKSREYERLSTENLGRKKYELRMLFSSANFEESRVTYVAEDSGDLSLRDACFGKRRSTNKRSDIPSNVDFKCKGDIGKGMTGGHKEGTQQNNIYGKSTLLHWWTSVTSKSTSTSWWMFARAISSVEIKTILSWYNHWRSGWRLSLMKSCEHHHWIFRNVWNEFWQVVDYEITVHHYAKKEENFDNLCYEFTAYRGISQIRLTRFEQRWNEDDSSSVHREIVAFTMRVKSGLLEKQQLSVDFWSMQGDFIVTTMNLEFHSSCRKKGHSLIYWNILMLIGLLKLIWMSCKKSGSVIIGMSIRASTCQTHGGDLQSSLCWNPKGYMWSREDDS